MKAIARQVCSLVIPCRPTSPGERFRGAGVPLACRAGTS